MAEREPSTTPVVPAVAGLVAAGMMTVGFGAGYGARAWNNSEAKRELRAQNKNFYPGKMFLKQGFGHGGLPDRDQIQGMYSAVRDPVPRNLVWEPTDSVVSRFAWLELPDPAKKQLVEASCEGNRIEMQLTNVEALNLYLDERLVDFSKPVVVTVNGKEVVNRLLHPSLSTLCRTLEERGDPKLAFTVKGPLPLQLISTSKP